MTEEIGINPTVEDAFTNGTFRPNELKRITTVVERNPQPQTTDFELFLQQKDIDTASETFQTALDSAEQQQLESIQNGSVAVIHGTDIIFDRNHRGELRAQEARDAIRVLQQTMAQVTNNELIATSRNNVVSPAELKEQGKLNSLAGTIVGTLSALTRHSFHRLATEEGQLDIVDDADWDMLGHALATVHNAKSAKPDQVRKPTINDTAPEAVVLIGKMFEVGDKFSETLNSNDATKMEAARLRHKHLLGEIGLPGPIAYGYSPLEKALAMIQEQIANNPADYCRQVGVKTLNTINTRTGQILTPSLKS